MLVQLQGLFFEEELVFLGSIECVLELLCEGCSGCGVELVEVVLGFCFQIINEVYGYIIWLWIECKICYICVILEMLVLIVYCQLIICGEIEQVCGVVVSSNIIQVLEECEWICVIGYCDVFGWLVLFGIIKGFLDYFGFKCLDELLLLFELCDLGELELQLLLDSDGQLVVCLVVGVVSLDFDGDSDVVNDDGILLLVMGEDMVELDVDQYVDEVLFLVFDLVQDFDLVVVWVVVCVVLVVV